MVPDEPLLSPKRLWFSVMEWLYYRSRAVPVGLGHLLVYHRRPHRAHDKGVY